MLMEHWELAAREAIRDLAARYNANGDTGRFAQVVELFAPDAVMDVGDGRDEILTIFTDGRDRARANGGERWHVRHMMATHQIDVEDESHAKGYSYYQVLTAIGLDHWGRYIDEYRVVESRWRFARRRVTLDGSAEKSLMAPRGT